jgi:hypothetical protein
VRSAFMVVVTMEGVFLWDFNIFNRILTQSVLKYFGLP